MRKKEIEEIFRATGIKSIDSYPIMADRTVEAVGVINNFFIYRRSYYWVLTGKMPLKYAEELFKFRKELKIRVNGGSEDDKPIDWCTSDLYEEYCNKIGDLFSSDLMSIGEFSKKLTDKWKELKESSLDDFYIEFYHIDTNLGLKKVIDTIRDNNIKTEW